MRMKYGCIGERLSHSFSREIHGLLADYEYELKEIPRAELGDFAASGDFLAVNVTLPYKEEIIPYLANIDENAEEIGAVNTVVNRGGQLYGYNTDFFGLSELIRHAGIEVRGKKAVILGTGGTSKTAYAVLRALGASSITKVSRKACKGAVTYDELREGHRDTEIIINTTPVGMFPGSDESPLEIRGFASLSGVADVVYNPMRTRLVMEAEALGIPAEGGLYMLVAQAVRASEIFTDRKYPEGTVDAVYKSMLARKENIVLVGMPSSGKSTVGKILAEKLSLPFYDTDELIEKRESMPICEIFKKYGEQRFREIEGEVIKETAKSTGTVIATGGGAVLRAENVAALKQNGRLYFIDRPLEALVPTDDRPLAKSTEDIKKRYSERYDIYLSSSDIRIDADCTAHEVADKILKKKEQF